MVFGEGSTTHRLTEPTAARSPDRNPVRRPRGPEPADRISIERAAAGSVSLPGPADGPCRRIQTAPDDPRY